MMMRTEDIAGATVLRSFRFGSTPTKHNDKLTREQVLGMPAVNRQALVDKGFIALTLRSAFDAEDVEKHVVSIGFGRFNVIEGRIINEEPLTREEALRLAGKPMDEVSAPAGARKRAKAETQ